MVAEKRTYLQAFMVALMLFFTWGSIHSQYVEVKTELDTNQVLIGDHFNFLISIIQPENVRVDYPQFTDTLIDKIEILERTLPDTTQQADNQLRITQNYRLTSFDSGLYVLPPIPFYLSMDGWTDSIMSNPVYLGVYTVPLDSAGRIFDIKQPLDSPLHIAELWPYVLSGILVILAGVFLFHYFKRRRKEEPLRLYRRPVDPPHVIALKELERLEGEKLWQQGNDKEYYSRLTEVIRNYLEAQFGIRAMEMTSEEILEDWERSGDGTEELKQMLAGLLGLADLVKFAKEKPLPSFNEANMNHAFEFVQRTRPVKIEEAKEPEQEIMTEHAENE